MSDSSGPHSESDSDTPQPNAVNMATLTLPWLDAPKPTSKDGRQEFKIKLKQCPHIYIGEGQLRQTWPPADYPYRPYVVTSRAVTCAITLPLKKPYAILHYFEILGQGDPPHDIGYPGDIYVDLTPRKYRLHYRDRTQWRRYSSPTLMESLSSDGRGYIPPQFFKKIGDGTRHPFVQELILWIDKDGVGWTKNDDELMLQTLYNRPWMSRGPTEHAALARIRHIQEAVADFKNSKRPLALDSAPAEQSKTPSKKRRIVLDSDESSSEDGDDTNSVQDDEDASVDAPEPEVVPEETNFDILDDKENSASPSTDDTSEQKPEVCTEQKPLNASAAVDTSVPSEDNLVEHIGNVLGSLKAAREAQKAAEHERDETKGSLEAAVSQQSAAIRERDDARRGRDERDKTISELQTSLKFAEDENARVAAALRLSDQANLMRAEKRSKLKEALLALAQSL